MVCNLEDPEVLKLFDSLGKLVVGVFTETKQILKLELELSRMDLEKQQGQGFWKDLTSDEQDSLNQSLKNNTIFNPSEVATADVQFGSIFSTLFGGPAVVSKMETNISNKFSDKINGTFDSSYASCDNAVSAIGIVQGIVGIQGRKLHALYKSATATFGMLLEADPTLGPAVFIQALKNYLIKSTVQNLLLEQIQDEIKQINEEIAKLTDDDYIVNHKTVLSDSINELRLADNILRAQLDNVLRKFPINMKGYAAAQQHIDNVRDVLCGIDLKDIFGGYLSVGVLKVSARLIYLQELLRLLDVSDQETQRILLNLGSFETAYENVTFFDDLFVPVLQMLRCRLSVVMSDMKATIDKNKLASFIVKEKEWCLELAILSSIMNAAKVFDIDTSKGPLSVDGLIDPLNDLFLTVKNQNFNVTIPSILGAADAYIRNVQYKLSFNAPVRPVQTRGELVIKLATQRIIENKAFGVMSNQQTLLVQGSILSGLTILSKYMQSLKNIDSLGTAIVQLEEGNLGGLLKGDFLSDTLSSVFGKVLGELETSLINAGCSLQTVGTKTLQGYQVFEDTTRADALFNESLAGFPETRLREVITAELPKYNVK